VSQTRFALVAGGGTGGHLVPALAVARALAAGRPPGSVELVGSRRGLDRDLLAEAGVPVTLLPGRGIVRRADPASLLANAAALCALSWAVVLALGVVARRRPGVVVAMGGYASVPVALAAAVLAVPVVLVNVDARPGAANRLVGRFAKAAAVAFPGTPLPRAVVTGAPVRAEIVAAARPSEEDRLAARRQLGIPKERRVVAAVGGSLGARRINAAVLELAQLWSGRADVALYHVVGSRDYEWTGAEAPEGPTALWYQQVEYERHMAFFYQAADVVVCRAGANTVAELAVVGVASVLVPLPGAPGDHQGANAAALAGAGAAVVIDDAECDGARLAAELDALWSRPGALGSMAEAAASLGRPDALAAVTAVVEAHARQRRGPDPAGTAVQRGAPVRDVAP
jgi:UDP-N-acetylglucosamine--N-acetylmuramyl-(pentapeptide) pyrophosphoryl-undecaprenol N-acetylglucosamine transferase